jgi:hypothetical protein
MQGGSVPHILLEQVGRSIFMIELQKVLIRRRFMKRGMVE